MVKNLAADSIMAADKMKPLLALSMTEPLQAAIGLTSDGDGVILLDKKAKPRAMMGMLKARAAKAQIKLNPSSVRFGRAEVNADYDPSMVRFFVNKDAPSMMRVKLIEVVKPIAFQKVEINVDLSLEEEPEDGVPGKLEEAAPSPASNTTDLLVDLRSLIGRIAAVAGQDAPRKATLTRMAADAGNALKAGHQLAAVDAIAQLRTALDAIPALSGAAAATPVSDPVAYDKARLTWIATRRKMLADVDRLAALVRADYEDEGLAETIAAQFTARAAPVLAHFDESLADRLQDVIHQTDPAKRTLLVGQARKVLDDYQAHLASEPLIVALDDNPYTKLELASILARTLTALSAIVH